ncbi:MAG: shikimate kinase [Oscillospiraceae bacterium]|nr:shikimate kinase [Oscillospiraceae bacterium]
MKNIILIGMPATGKSTVGVILAKLIGYNFLDTDILLSLEKNRPLSQIISEDGYDKFIEYEGKIGAGIKTERTVIATGGSMVFSENAMRTFSNSGTVVWLDTPVADLEKRMLGTLLDRGVATPVKMTMNEIYEMREPLYRKYADYRVSCEGATEHVVANLRALLIRENLI